MSINPNGAPPGYYYQAGATAYVIDPAGTYSVGGATVPTTDPAGTYSGSGASAPTLAEPGPIFLSRGDLIRSGVCRPCRRLQSGGRERADDRS